MQGDNLYIMLLEALINNNEQFVERFVEKIKKTPLNQSSLHILYSNVSYD